MSNEYEQPVEPMSRTEDLLRTGTEEPVIAMSRIEKILRGEKITPQSRIEDLLLKYNPSDILIEKSVTENGTYYAKIDNADGYYKVVVDTPVPQLNTRTIKNNGKFISSVDGYDGYDSVIIDVDNGTPNYKQLTVTQNGVYVPPSSSIETFGLADGIPEEVETKVYAAGSVTRKDNLTVKCYDKVSHTGVTATINTSSIADKATPQSLREKTLIICEDANHYVYITKAGQNLFVTQKGYTFNGQSFELQDNASAYSMVNVNVPKNVTSRELQVNGTFASSVDNKDGYSNVTVNVQEAPVKTTSLTVTENGTYEPDPASEVSLTIPTIPDEVETDVSAGADITNFDNLRVEFTNKTTGATGHVDIYPSAIAIQQIPMSFKNRTLIMGPDGGHYITLVNGYDSIVVLQKGYTITAMKLTSYSGYFNEVTVNVESGGGTIVNGEILTDNSFTDDFQLFSEYSMSNTTTAGGKANITWNGGTSIGYCKCGKTAYRNAKKIKVHIDYYGDSYGHQHTNNRNWNFAVFVTDIQLTSAVTLTNFVSDPHCLDYIECDNNQYYGKTNLDFEIDLSEITDPVYISFQSPGVTIQGLKITMVYEDEGDLYKYLWSSDEKICIREGIGEIKWFFNGYVTDSGEDPYPQEFKQFIPSGALQGGVILGPAYSTSAATEQVGWIGFYRNKIRVWSMDKGNLITGTFYGVVDALDSSAEQHEVYKDPLDIPDIDISVIEKTITENGTYSAEDDGYVGYSDVSVNVPLPQNAYLLKSVANLPQAIASFNDGQEMVMPSLKVAIEPQQEGSGDPSPTNVRPISGWDKCNVGVNGVNVWNEEWRIDGAQFKAKNLILVKPNTSYYFKSPLNASSAFKYDVNGNSLGPMVMTKDAVFTTDSKTYYIWFSLSANDYGTTYNNDISINYPSTDTEYHAYNGATYTIDLDGTRYGGTLDVVSGVLTVDRVGVDMGDLSQPWGYVSNENRFTNGSLASLIKTPSTDGITVEAITSQLKVLSLNDLKGSSNDTLLAVGDTGTISVRYTSCGTDTEAIKTALTGVELVYKLATPITIQLTPTAVKSLLGSNNVWADTGDIKDAEYFSQVDDPSGS